MDCGCIHCPDMAFFAIGEIQVHSVHIGECSGTMIWKKTLCLHITPCASWLGRELSRAPSIEFLLGNGN